jgi:hypothetical protein
MKLNLRVGVSDSGIPIEKHNLVYALSNKINLGLKGKQFGDDVIVLDIAFIMTFYRPGYEEWHKERKPKYIAYKKSVSKLTGEVIETVKTIACDIQLSDESINQFIHSDDDTSKSILLNELINALEKLKPIIKKIDFDLQKFNAALVEFSISEKIEIKAR